MILLKTVGITVVIAVLFYRSFCAAVIFPFVYFVEVRHTKRVKEESRRAKLLEEFLHGIGVLNGALQAGLSMENAWREVE